MTLLILLCVRSKFRTTKRRSFGPTFFQDVFSKLITRHKVSHFAWFIVFLWNCTSKTYVNILSTLHGYWWPMQRVSIFRPSRFGRMKPKTWSVFTRVEKRNWSFKVNVPAALTTSHLKSTSSLYFALYCNISLFISQTTCRFLLVDSVNTKYAAHVAQVRFIWNVEPTMFTFFILSRFSNFINLTCLTSCLLFVKYRFGGNKKYELTFDYILGNCVCAENCDVFEYL